MPRPLQSILSCFRPTPTAEERASTSTGQPVDSAPHPPRRAPVTLQGLANFDAQRIRQRQVEIQALVPDTRKALSDGECQLGGYVHARQVDGRPVEGTALDRLKRGNETVMETRQALAHGRGNVTADINDSNGLSTIRTEAGRNARPKIPRHYGQKLRVTASTLAAQAGNCGEHAYVATFLHAGKLQKGERVHCVGSTKKDHGWAELRGKTSDRAHDVVMDPWAKGPAIFAIDGALSKDKHAVETEHHYDRRSGAKAHAKMQKLQRKEHSQIQADVHEEMAKLGPDFRYPSDESSVWSATPVISKEFAERVVDKMIQEPDPAKLAPKHEDQVQQAAERVGIGERRMAPLRQEVHATQIARTLGASGVKEVSKAAARIAHVAVDLQRYPLASHPAQTAPNDV